MNVPAKMLNGLEDYHVGVQQNILIYPVGRKVAAAVKKMGYVPQGSQALLPYQVILGRQAFAC